MPLLCLAVHGCTRPDGGAVELSWALRSTEDREVTDCANDRIEDIELWWQTDDLVESRAFACDDRHGTTGFELPPGPVTLWVQPTCVYEIGPRCFASPTPCECLRKPADSATFEAPPPLVRQVVAGETITLDAVVMVIDAVAICQPELLCP